MYFYNNKVWKVLSVLVLMTVLVSCVVNRKSVIVRENIHVGMTVDMVTAKLGLPFDKAITDTLLNGKNTIKKIYFYRETLWTGSRQLDVENILVFYDDVLMEIKKGKESPVYTRGHIYKED